MKANNRKVSLIRISVISVDPWLDRLHGASILGLLRSLSSLGYNIEVVLPSHSSSRKVTNSFSIKTFKSSGIPVLAFFSFLVRVVKHLVTTKPDLMIFDAPTMPCFLCLKILRKTKGIMQVLSRPLEEASLKGLLNSFQFSLSLKISKLFAEAFIAISPFEAMAFSSLGNIPRGRFFVLPSPLGENFLNINLMDEANRVKSRLPSDALAGKKIFLYHGVLDTRRGVMKVVDLFARSSDKDSMVLLLVGDGKARESVREFIQREKVNNIVLMNPLPYSDMPGLIAACDVGLVLLPGNEFWRYQAPTKLVEFLALNKPVLASDLAGIRWIADACSNVVYVESLEQLTIENFGQALQDVLAKEDDSTPDGPCSRRMMIDRFSNNFMAAKLGKIIDSLK